MSLKSRASHRNDNHGRDGKKRQKTKGFHEAISEMRSAAVEAEMARRKALSDEKARAAEEEVARMTFGPSYRDAG